ncbi:CHAD domain-containing protein [Paraburkholderia caledonica]
MVRSGQSTLSNSRPKWIWTVTGPCRGETTASKLTGSGPVHRSQERALSPVRSHHWRRPVVAEAVQRARDLSTQSDADGFHQLRVAFRRLRALYWAYSPYLGEEATAQRR